MTTETTADNASPQPLGLGSSEGLGRRLRNAAAADRIAFELAQQALPEPRRMAFVGQHLCEEAADKLEGQEKRLAIYLIRECTHLQERANLEAKIARQRKEITRLESALAEVRAA